jgi:hypothetical protein
MDNKTSTSESCKAFSPLVDPLSESVFGGLSNWRRIPEQEGAKPEESGSSRGSIFSSVSFAQRMSLYIVAAGFFRGPGSFLLSVWGIAFAQASIVLIGRNSIAGNIADAYTMACIDSFVNRNK